MSVAYIDPDETSDPQDLTHELFDGLSQTQRATLQAFTSTRRIQPGDRLLTEGEPDPHLYIVQCGALTVSKSVAPGREVTIVAVGPGAVLGELKLARLAPSSATVTATSDVQALAIDLRPITTDPNLADIRSILSRNATETLTQRLRRTTHGEAEALIRQLKETTARAYVSRFMHVMFGAVALISIISAGWSALPLDIRPAPSLLLLSFAILLLLPVSLAIERSPFQRRDYGLTWDNAARHAAEAIILTVPLLLIATAIKLAAIEWVLPEPAPPLFEQGRSYFGPGSGAFGFAATILLYTVFVGVQEFVARCGFQATLELSNPAAPPRIHWTAILVSNLLFASAHSWASIWFVILAFVPGIYWGWMFARQRSLVGVTVSHALAGLWALYALGLNKYLVL